MLYKLNFSSENGFEYTIVVIINTCNAFLQCIKFIHYFKDNANFVNVNKKRDRKKMKDGMGNEKPWLLAFPLPPTLLYLIVFTLSKGFWSVEEILVFEFLPRKCLSTHALGWTRTL